MDETQKNVAADEGDDSEALQALRRLAVGSPQDSLQRFRRRAAVVQGTRMLFESQITGFWTVLDAFLRLALGGKTTQLKAADSQGDEA